MPDEKKNDSKGTCFVVMGFGKKTDFETGRVLDLDKSYKNMIKPAVEAAGLKCIRADEIVHSGLIDVPMYEQLLKADVVVADLSTSNKNAFYELGVRHALRPFTTVIISEDGVKSFPFDVSHVAIRQYHHLGEDIGFEEVMRFREQLTASLKELSAKNPHDKDSPVYTFLNELTPPAIAAAVQAKLQEVVSEHLKEEDGNAGSQMTNETHSVLMQQVDDAQKRGDWITAKTLLSLIRQMMKNETSKKRQMSQKEMIEQPEDPYIVQRLSLVTYKSKFPNEETALFEASELLNSLNPATSNDTETLGMYGAVNKRLWEIKKDAKYLDAAIRAYKRGFYIRNDYYNGINYAFLLNIRGAVEQDVSEAIADFVEARRLRKEVLLICEQWLKDNPSKDKDTSADYLKSWYWVAATMGESYVGLGEETKAQPILEEAYSKAPEGWMKTTTEEQLRKLRLLLANSPLQHIKN